MMTARRTLRSDLDLSAARADREARIAPAGPAIHAVRATIPRAIGPGLLMNPDYQRTGAQAVPR